MHFNCTFDAKYFIYCFFIGILELYINFFIYEYDKKILNEHKIFDIFCYYFGYLFNIIPTLFSNQNYMDNNPDDKGSLAKEIIKFFSISFVLLLIQAIVIIPNIMDDNEDKQEVNYGDNFILYLILIMFFLLKYFKNVVFYKHQKMAFLTFLIIETIKTIFFLFKNNIYNDINAYLGIILKFVYSIFLTIYYMYIDGLMRHKFISPYKCSFLIGAGFVPLIIIIYFIFSFTNYFDNIFDLFKSFGELEVINAIIFEFYLFYIIITKIFIL